MVRLAAEPSPALAGFAAARLSWLSLRRVWTVEDSCFFSWRAVEYGEPKICFFEMENLSSNWEMVYFSRSLSLEYVFKCELLTSSFLEACNAGFKVARPPFLALSISWVRSKADLWQV